MGAVTLTVPTLADVSRIFSTSFASVYPHYVTKVEKKGRTKADLNQVISWLTGFDESALSGHLAAGTTFRIRTPPAGAASGVGAVEAVMIG